MELKSGRVKERTTLESVLKFVHDYAYFETLTIVFIYLLIGYFINKDDICMLNGEISYILILLSVITLFHGFENGMLTVGILAVAMWMFYPSFQYVEFLVALMMTMIFSEFHYYWTQKIKTAEINANYRGAKLDELSKAFYTLKISHDQLEKNYVVKPMSIRNSIEYIINKNVEINETVELKNRDSEYYRNFLGLLEKSFNVQSAIIVYQKSDSDEEYLTLENSEMTLGSSKAEIELKEVFEDYLVDKAISRKVSVYISDAKGEPTVEIDKNSKYLAVIPSIQGGKIRSVLIIEKMPFMSFNREILTSISILIEYFSIEIKKKDMLMIDDKINIVPDENFRFEYERLHHLYLKYKVDSIILVLRLDNELQSARIYEKIIKMLRSLDMACMLKKNDFYYITLMFPLHDKAAALGYLNRLIGSIDEEKDKKFNYMTFNMSQTDLLNKYYREDYDN